MYTQFLRALAEIAEYLDAAAKVGGGATAVESLPTPYLSGSIEVRLDGALVGRFIFEDEWVIYEPDSPAPETTVTEAEKYDPTEEPFA